MNNLFTITSVKTIFENKKQFICFQLNKKYINYLIHSKNKFESITFPDTCINQIGIKICELELLIGSNFEAEYYEIGHVLPNGILIRSTNQQYYIKKWKLLMNGTLQELKEKNKHLFLKFETIYKIKNVGKNDLIWIYVRNGKLDYLYTIPELERLTGINENEYNLLKGALIIPIFYEVGERHNSWLWPVQGETTVKELNLRMVNTNL